MSEVRNYGVTFPVRFWVTARNPQEAIDLAQDEMLNIIKPGIDAGEDPSKVDEGDLVKPDGVNVKPRLVVRFEMDNMPNGIDANALKNILCTALSEYQEWRSGVYGTAERYVEDRYGDHDVAWQKEKAAQVERYEQAAEAMRNGCAKSGVHLEMH